MLSVVDYVVVPRSARGDMRVFSVQGHSTDHRALWASLAARAEGGVGASTAARSPERRAAVVRLTATEAAAFRASEWLSLTA